MSKRGLPGWIAESRGVWPTQSWAFTTDAPLVALELARETSEVLAGDESGGIYLLDRMGQIAAMSRGYHNLTGLAWADTGEAGFVLCDESKICYLDRRLKMLWSRRMPDAVLAIACESYGNHVAISLSNGNTFIFNSEQKRVAAFKTVHPLKFLKFLTTEKVVIGAADYGLVGAYTLEGRACWQEKVWSRVGDLSVTGDGSRVFLASFNQGVQVYDATGKTRGAYLVEGTATRVTSTFDATNVGVTTTEQFVHWLDAPGQMLWSAQLPEPAREIRSTPLGDALVFGFESGRVVRLDWLDER